MGRRLRVRDGRARTRRDFWDVPPVCAWLGLEEYGRCVKSFLDAVTCCVHAVVDVSASAFASAAVLAVAN